MSTTAWVCPVTFTASNGNLTQLFPVFCQAGTNPATATPSQWVRQPCEGELMGLQVQTDGANGGIIEIWDINGQDAGADVSSAAVITNTQLLAMKTAGKARLLYSQNLLATGETPPMPTYFRFLKGLAARFVASAGAVNVNANVNGGYRLIHGSV